MCKYCLVGVLRNEGDSFARLRPEKSVGFRPEPIVSGDRFRRVDTSPETSRDRLRISCFENIAVFTISLSIQAA